MLRLRIPAFRNTPSRVRTPPRKLVYPRVYTPIDEVDLTRNYVRRPAGKKRVADEIPDLEEFEAQLQSQATIVVSLRAEALECFADESQPYVHSQLGR